MEQENVYTIKITQRGEPCTMEMDEAFDALIDVVNKALTSNSWGGSTKIEKISMYRKDVE